MDIVPLACLGLLLFGVIDHEAEALSKETREAVVEKGFDMVSKAWIAQVAREASQIDD
jgi:hypothetical protein